MGVLPSPQAALWAFVQKAVTEPGSRTGLRLPRSGSLPGLCAHERPPKDPAGAARTAGLTGAPRSLRSR